MNQPKRGRPPILDETKRARICGVLSVGGSKALAATAVDCCVRTIYNTMERDEKFREEVQRARAGCEIKLLKCIDDAAMEPRYWRAAAWKLERLRPERYRTRKVNTVTQLEVNEFVEQLFTVVKETIDEHTLTCTEPANPAEDAEVHDDSALADKPPVAPEDSEVSLINETSRVGARTHQNSLKQTKVGASTHPTSTSGTHTKTEEEAKADLLQNIITRLLACLDQHTIQSNNALELLLDYLHLPTRDPPADAA